jgi:hypothetical protein
MRCSNMTVDATTVVQLLREFAARISLRGGNPYRAKAYGVRVSVDKSGSDD